MLNVDSGRKQKVRAGARRRRSGGVTAAGAASVMRCRR